MLGLYALGYVQEEGEVVPWVAVQSAELAEATPGSEMRDRHSVLNWRLAPGKTCFGCFSWYRCLASA